MKMLKFKGDQIILDLFTFPHELENYFGFQTKIKWKVVLIVVLSHLIPIVSSYYYAFPVKWQTFAYGAILYFLAGFGVTCGAHRLWAHKSYKVTLPLKIFLVFCFASNGQMPIYDWVRIHRQHHKYSDTDADPHNANRGLFYSHIGWLMLKKHDLVHAKGRQIDMSDIENDKVLMFEKKYAYLSMNLCCLLPVLVPIYFWGEDWKCSLTWTFFLKNLFVSHAAMTVNSVAHKFGYKPYNKNIKPTDNIWVTIYALGEGTHNYHHMFPCDYKCAETIDFVNISTALIRLWAKMGLAYDLKEPNPELIKATVNRLNSIVSVDSTQ